MRELIRLLAEHRMSHVEGNKTQLRGPGTINVNWSEVTHQYFQLCGHLQKHNFTF